MKNWRKLSIQDRVDLMASYRELGYSRRDAIQDFEKSVSLPKFEDGGFINDTPIYTDEQVEAFPYLKTMNKYNLPENFFDKFDDKSHGEFYRGAYRDYINSPAYQKTLNNTLEGNYDHNEASQFLNDRLNVPRFKFRSHREQYRDNSQGAFERLGDTISLNTDDQSFRETNRMFNQLEDPHNVAIHEISHSQENNRYLSHPTNNVPIPPARLDADSPTPPRRLKSDNTFPTFLEDKWGKLWNERGWNETEDEHYLGNREEIRANLNVARESMHRKGINWHDLSSDELIKELRSLPGMGSYMLEDGLKERGVTDEEIPDFINTLFKDYAQGQQQAPDQLPMAKQGVKQTRFRGRGNENTTSGTQRRYINPSYLG